MGATFCESQEDNVLIENVIGDCCEKSLLELIQRHERLYYKISHRYSSHSSLHGATPEDISDNKNYIIYQALLSFDPERKVKFSTWLGNYVRYSCLNQINKDSKFLKTGEDSLEYFFNSKSLERYEDLKLKDENEFVFNILGQLKDKRIHAVFKLRYFSGEKKMTWANIAKKIKVSTQTAINLHNKGRKILIKKYNTKNTNRIDNI